MGTQTDLGQALNAAIDAALREDMPEGDITSGSIIPAEARSEAFFLAKEDGVLAGLEVAARVFAKIDPSVIFIERFRDGSSFHQGDKLARVKGPTAALLGGERTALNFLQHLCGVATATRRFVEAVAGTKAKILDTRKTTPGLRLLEKYAVRTGGGTNHRLSLSDMILIKDNHLRFVGSVSEAVRRARAKARPGVRVEVEAASLLQVREALAAGADIIMLDNMPLETMTQAVALAGGRVPLEASGNMTLDRVRAVAETGVDFISVGALTHSARAVDISLDFVRRGGPA
ncbi:MAG TPA: carboxylating nicotinate-nucleotide diphosphorylase [Candidatus Aminicenantes bacterium]|nr:carboxylating nicotinate-nucleotide diphosphorylase [Candidatus Aminicenantes bacterium]HRY65554.1 carboxylating nicotinate-nucleotide diphosphorylase [Candidatus Aminicenantes bacterium]HRZ72558.1 carboxylating nicotinate-nucleotide diphosphorylase [Candidatus Aminicenantes bacterium]